MSPAASYEDGEPLRSQSADGKPRGYQGVIFFHQVFLVRPGAISALRPL